MTAITTERCDPPVTFAEQPIAHVELDGRFRLEEPIGRGGMAQVYRAVDLHTGRRIAVKILFAPGPATLLRFAREASLLAQLDHPAIVRFLAEGITPGGQPYIAMDWIEGQDLERRLRRGPLSTADTVALARRIAQALGAAHQRGVVHRDVKPSNIALPDGLLERAVILDFGVAHLRDASLTIPGERVGTPTYMAPEQVLGVEDIGPAADVFALGCVLFECLTGRRAFAGDDAVAVHAKVILDDPPRVSELEPGVPAALDSLVMRMLAKKPGERPADGREVVAELDAFGSAVHAGVQRRPILSGGERTIVSVVLASHVDRLAVDFDHPTLPRERVRDQEDSLMRTLRELGVEVERLSDGSVIATVAGSGSPGDRATQAARVALSLRRKLPGLGVVLATGLSTRGRAAVGDVIDRAVLLLRQAAERASVQPDPEEPAIVLDEVTAGLLDTRFEVAFDGAGFTLRGERGPLEVGRTLIGKITPFVGRARELGELEMSFAESVEESDAHAILVVGPAGAGKSRLAAELLRRLQRRRTGRPQAWFARADPSLAGSPYHLLGQLVRAALGVDDSHSREAIQRKLRARLAGTFAGDDLTRLTVFLGQLLLIGAADGDPDYVPLQAAQRDARVMADQLRWAWADWMRAHLAAGPILVVLDDLHWGDLTTAKLIEDSLREFSGEPLMVVGLARPEIDEALPEIEASGLFERRRVRPLSRRARERLVAEVLGPEVGGERLNRIANRSEGNPFLLEELIRAEAEGRDEIPETALAVVQARLDGIDVEARRLLRAASVFGESFSYHGALYLLGQDAPTARSDAALAALCRNECIAEKSRSAGRAADAHFVFRHALVREAAYRTLTAPDRQIGHGLAGDWMERRAEADPLVLAHHFERGPDARRAVRWLELAARRALDADDLAAVHARAQRAAECGADRGERARLAAIEAEAFMWEGDNPRCVLSGLHAVRRLARGGPDWCRATGSAAVAAARMGKRQVLALLGRELMRAEMTPVSADEYAWLAVRVSLQLRYVGESTLAELLLAGAERAAASLSPPMRRLVESYRGGIDANFKPQRYALQVEVFRELGDRFRSAQARINHGYALITVGAYAEARAALVDALSEAERMRSAVLLRHAQNNLGLCLYRLGELAEAADLELGALGWFADTGDRRLECVTHIYLSLIGRAAGDLPAALEHGERAVELSRTVPLMQAFALASHADALRGAGRVAEALAAARRAQAIPPSDIEEGEELARLLAAETLTAAGFADEARFAVTEAAARVVATSEQIPDPAHRHSFLAAIPENARLLRLAGR